MMDQASRLRKQVQFQSAREVVGLDTGCQVVAVTSGKGGVGKTYVVVNLAIALRRAGKRVAILDADLGLANVDVVLGLAPKFHLGHVIEGVQPLRSILVEGPEGVRIIPASSGIQELTMMGDRKRQKLLAQLRALMDDYDYILIDTAAGISDNVIRFLTASRRVIVVSNSEPTAMVDAYALIKVLLRKDMGKELLMVVNGVSESSEAEEVHGQLSRVVERFLDSRVHLLGSLPWDERVCLSVRQQQPLLVSHPRALASRCFLRIADRLLSRPAIPSEIERLCEKVV